MEDSSFAFGTFLELFFCIFSICGRLNPLEEVEDLEMDNFQVIHAHVPVETCMYPEGPKH